MSLIPNNPRQKTLFYAQNGGDYGAERYLRNRRVEWSFLDGEMQSGSCTKIERRDFGLYL